MLQLLLLPLLRGRVRVKVEDEELRLLGAVARTDGADQLRVVGANPPHDAAAAARGQRHQVTNELACKKLKEVGLLILL